MLNALRTVIGNRAIRIATITMFFLGFTYASTIPYQSIIGITELGLTSQQFGAVMFAAAIIGTLGSVIIGHFSDISQDRKRVVLTTLSVGAVGYGTFWLVPTVPTFVLCLVVIAPIAGAGISQLYAVIRAVTAPFGAAEAASINSTVRAIFATSWILVPGIVGAFIAYTGRAFDAYGIAALAYIFCLGLYTLFGPKGGRADPPTLGRWEGLVQAFRQILSGPIMARIGALALIGAAHPINAVLLPLIVMNLHHGTTREIGILAGLVAALEIPFMLLGGYLATRWPVARVVALGGLCHASYLLALAFAGSITHIYALAILNGAGAAILLSLHLSYLQDLMPDRPGLGTSLYSVEQLMMRSLGAMIVAGVGLMFGYAGALMLTAILGLAGAILILVLDRKNTAPH